MAGAAPRVAVLAGGAIGTALRLGVVAGVGAVPWGTLVVNVTGAGVLGFVTGRLGAGPAASPVTALVATGVLGAYTTFSALAVELLALLDGAPAAALAYGVGSLVCGLGAAAAGLAAGHHRPGPTGARR